MSIMMIIFVTALVMCAWMKISGDAREAFNGINADCERYGLGDLLDNCSGVTEGKQIYVDGNRAANGDGKSWATAYNVLATALADSHADIAISVQRGWANRNKIYCKGDDLEENLVALAQKTDIIGVGSSDPYKKCCVRGNHVPVNNAMGCRFINMRFRPAASGDLWTLATTTGGGIEFHGCLFSANYSTFVAPSAIDITASQYVRIEDCEFLGAFSGDVIDIGSGRTDSLMIRNNTIRGGADNGIVVTGTPTTALGRNLVIDKNFVQVADKTIDDNAVAIVFVTNNTCISAEALGASSHVITIATAANNMVTGNDNTELIPAGA